MSFIFAIGRIGYLKNKRKGTKTNSSGNPTLKSKNNNHRTNPNGDTSTTQTGSQTGSKSTKRRHSTVYTNWGRAKCPDYDDIATLYSGKFNVSVMVLMRKKILKTHMQKIQQI